MSEQHLCFQSHAKLFRQYALDIMAKNSEYPGIASHFESVLLLADRLFALFSEHFQFNQTGKIAMLLAQISDAIEQRQEYEGKVDELVRSLEPWLKSLLWLIKREQWDKLMQNERTFDLATCLRHLKLLTQEQLDRSSISSNDTRHLIRLVLEDRNQGLHVTYEPPPYVQSRQLSEALITLLASVYKHSDKIKQRLRGLIVSPISSKEVEDLLVLVDGERRKHLDNFRAREKWVQKLRERLEAVSNQTKPYILLIGHEGLGKSALVAKLTEVNLKAEDVIGPNMGSVRKMAPWLPKVILHFGKQSKQPDEIVRSLIAQLNTLLLKPFVLPETSDYRSNLPSMDIAGGLPVDLLPATRWSISQHSGSNTVRRYELEDYGSSFRTQSTQLSQIPTSQDIQLFRRSLYVALERTVEECGPIILMIDALDEISPDGKGLEFLPESLPQGVSALLTARESSNIVNWMNVEIIRLERLDENEIPLLTQIDSSKGEDEANFNARVSRFSQGRPLLVLAAAQKAREQRYNLAAIEVDKSNDSLFQRQAEEWGGAGLDGASMMPDILLLLAIFEPATTLDLSLLQSFLRSQDIHLSLPDLRQLLSRVSVQLEGLEAGRIKLSLRAFAEYVLTRRFSPHDVQLVLEKLVSCLVIETDIDAKTMASLLQYWTGVKNDRHRRTFDGLVNALIERQDVNLLYSIYLRSQEKRAVAGELPPFVVRCLRAAADQGHVPAMLSLSDRLIDGSGLKKDVVQGEEWLRKAAETHTPRALQHLGSRLLNGSGLTQNAEEGEQLLRMAAETDDPNAKLELAMRLWNGDGLVKNDVESEQLLQDLADADDKAATFILAIRFLTSGESLTKREEGERILRDLAEAGDKQAKRLLAFFLINGVGLERNSKEGERLLRELADAGQSDAVIDLSNRLIKGVGLAENPQEGEQLLRQAIERGNFEAMRNLGKRLLAGDGLTQNLNEGESLLRRAVQADHYPSMVDLAIELLDGIHLPKKSKDGKQLLQRAVKSGDRRAVYELSDRLLSGRGLSKNTKEGAKLLRELVDKGDTLAMASFGVRLLEGDGFKQDITEGRTWLRRSAEKGEPQAMRILGDRLLKGDGFKQDITEGRTWLRRSAEKDEPQAMGVLGDRLLKGDGFEQDITEGRTWLRQAAEKGEPQAMGALGDRLLKGDGFKQDITEGRAWLQRAAEKGEAQAMLVLGIRLLDGDGFEQDIPEGRAWLQRAAEKGEAQAMRILGYRLLDGDGFKQDIEEGRAWLQRAAEKGEAQAMLVLGIRLLDGDGFEQGITEGRTWLRQAAEKGEPQAMRLLGDRLLDGSGFKQDIAEGRMWLNRAAEKGEPLAMRSLGLLLLYGNGVKQDVAEGRKLLKEAALGFLQSFHKGGHDEGNNLAFMARRAEVPDGLELPHIKELLTPYINQRKAIGIMNYALCQASGYECAKDWVAADQVIASISSPVYDVVYWWHHKLAVRGDPEGHLVVAWLVRHGFIEDPDGYSISDRVERARAGGWDVPEWFDSTTVPPQPKK
ncbi:sel1 repeat family protein [Chloroflexales bacterium ZM16-3]|nr:sel1 repeat family protein [Chloroflexales bacterium ZM16-3]